MLYCHLHTGRKTRTSLPTAVVRSGALSWTPENRAGCEQTPEPGLAGVLQQSGRVFESKGRRGGAGAPPLHWPVRHWKLRHEIDLNDDERVVFNGGFCMTIRSKQGSGRQAVWMLATCSRRYGGEGQGVRTSGRATGLMQATRCGRAAYARHEQQHAPCAEQ